MSAADARFVSQVVLGPIGAGYNGSMLRRPLVSIAALLVGPLAAQSAAWKIPPRGVVEFTREAAEFRYAASPPDVGGRVVLKTGAEGGEVWRYTRKTPAADWYRPEFSDGDWSEGRSAFGGAVDTDQFQRTVWKGDNTTIYLRTGFDVSDPKAVKAAAITVSHDDGVKIWLNGQLIVDDNGYHHDELKVLKPDHLRHLRAGRNHLAVECRNGGGAQVIDVGLRLHQKRVKKFVAQGFVEKEGRREWRGLFGPLRPPPLLFQADLDEDQQRLVRTPFDLRDVASFVALDLSSARTFQRTYKALCPRVKHFGDVSLQGRVAPMDAEGNQRMTLRVRSAAPAACGDSKRFMAGNVDRLCSLRVEGTLTIERHVDWTRGLVTGFSAQLEGVVEDADGTAASARELRWEERWSLRRVREPNDAEFRQDVVTAIKRGAAWIKQDISDLQAGRIGRALRPHPARSANSGRLGLALLTLVKSGVARNDPVVVAAFDELRSREILDSYSLGNALGALEAMYAPPRERDNLISGTITRPRQREPSPADMEVIDRWVEQLLDNMDEGVDQDELARFRYTPGRGYDNSVNQYGLLGMYSAHLCGVELPRGFWQAAANHLIEDQVVWKEGLRMSVATHRDLAAEGGAARGRKARAVRLGGWGYRGGWQGERPPVTGSTTTAGLSGLLMCRAAMVDLGEKRATILSEVDRAIEQGFAWLGANFDVMTNPGDLARAYHWTYYYLYGLERSCELAGVAHLQGHDWYFEGAMALLHWQRESGEWPPEHRSHGDDYGFAVERTSFAVLFLMKSALPVYSLGRK